MEFAEFRPILVSFLTALVVLGLARLWARWLPGRVNGKPAAWLVDTYRGTIRLANALFLGGCLLGIALYPLADFPSNDWRPVGLGLGGGCAMAVLVLLLYPLAWRGSPREACAAFAIAQGTPVPILYSLLGIGIAALVVAGSSWLP